MLKSMEKMNTPIKKIPKIFLLIVFFSLFALSMPSGAAEPRTSFQSAAEWSPEAHIPIDIAMFYGTNAAGIKSWADRGYETWAMFGASWLGKDENIVVANPQIVQVAKGGVNFEMIPGRAWVVPVGPWIDYTKNRITEALAGGAGGILPEEPEFFASNGYSESFKAEWRNFYGEDWRAPHSSVTAQWRASELKARLFTNFYREVFAHAKKTKPGVKTLIPVHSNINYADWKIIAPHHAFMSLGETDGFVAQVWTGTAKHRHFLGGESYANAFEYALLEYSYFAELVAGAGKEAWFLTDPVEDVAGAPWDDLRDWYEQTLVAALLQPSVNKYECVPWPQRALISQDTYGGGPIPRQYATELFTVWAAQREIPAGGEFMEDVNTEIGFLTSDTLMWQRGAGMDRFQGFLAPMLAAGRGGVFARVLPAERFLEPGYPPEDIKLIVASFDAWKPAKREIVDAIAAWVKRGGTLLFIGGADDYDGVEGAWWKEAGWNSPFAALLAALSLEVRHQKAYMPKLSVEIFTTATQLKTIESLPDAPAPLQQVAKASSPMPLSSYDVAGSKVAMTVGAEKRPLLWEADSGSGAIVYAGFPGEFVALKKEGVEIFLNLLRYALETRAGGELKNPRAFLLRRGKFIVGKGLREDVAIKGPFVNLLRPEEPISDTYNIKPGGNAFLLDVNEAAAGCGAAPLCLLHASGNVSDVSASQSGISFKIAGPPNRKGYAWIYVKSGKQPKVSGGFDAEWHPSAKVLRVGAPLSPGGTAVKLEI